MQQTVKEACLEEPHLRLAVYKGDWTRSLYLDKALEDHRAQG